MGSMEESSPSPRSDPITPLSISQINRLHRRERLLVPPVCWTARHLELLRCSFGDPSLASSTKTPVLPGNGGGCRMRQAFEYRKWKLPYRYSAISGLLGFDEPFARRENVRFLFNRRHSQTLRCYVFFSKTWEKPDAWPPIVAAYVDLGRIEDLRSELFMRPPGSRRCKSISGLARLKLKKITPTKYLHDPYIVALLIATAENRLRASTWKDTDLSFFTPQVLVSSDDKEHMHLYRARISSSFLRSLEDPTFAPSEAISIPIQIIIIPYQPYHSLRDRLTALLLPEQELKRILEMENRDSQP